MSAARHSLVLLIAVVSLLSACSDGGPLLPRSGGSPYSVLVVGDGSGTVARLLEAGVPGLPQAEPLFDVTSVPAGRLTATARLSRNLVVVTADSSLYTRTAVRYEKDVYAEPQMIVYITTPSLRRLRQELRPGTVERLLARHETNAEIARLSRHDNPKAEAEVRRMFGCRLRVPSSMTSSRKGDRFLWFSDNAAQGMTSICVYGSDNRDSVMRVNIKGETDAMYMRTVPGSVVTASVRERGRTIVIRRGLWEMEGDAMGGPFVSHTLVDTLTGRRVVAEAFVYAPSRRKRDLLLRAEAALYTLSFAAGDSRHGGRGRQ